MARYLGACHCEAVRIAVDRAEPIESNVECNCSVCTKKGVLLAGVEESELTVLKGQDAIETYRFNTRVAEHNFCRRCGVHVYTRPRNNPERFAVNIRCLDDFQDLRRNARLIPFDGQNHPKDAAPQD